ncbi:MAG TPA: acyl-CoA desaturase [Thermoleophilaceae bacterium]|nr:acyl-CoA desaturase [Thermoleophilaceae bacterium]
MNIAAVVLPFVCFIAAVPMLWNRLLGPLDVILFIAMYAVSTMGITVGFHRLLTHRAFATYKPVEYLFAISGSMAVEGPVTGWVTDHRRHHAHADEEGDPHSPHVGHGGGLAGTLRGLWHAHLGWLFDHPTAAGAEKYAPDMVEDRGMRIISRLFALWVALGLAIPFAVGWSVHGSLAGGFQALFWAGLVRIFLVHHVTFSINSICHFFGRRRFSTEDQSTNVFWLAIPSFGESWHHNHHAFPRSAFHGLRWWEIDIGGLAVRSLHRLGLAWNVVRISPERQLQRLADSTAARAEPGGGAGAAEAA